MLLKEQVNEILAVALQQGATFAEVYAEETRKDLISLINEKVDKSTSGIDAGVGIRVIANNRYIYSYTNDFSIENLKSIAKKSALALKYNDNQQVMPFMDYEKENLHISKIPMLDTHKLQVIEKIRNANVIAKKSSSLITETSGNLLCEVHNILIANSEGVFKSDTREYVRTMISSIASTGSNKQVGTCRPGIQGGFEFFETLDFDEIGESTAKSAVTMLGAGYMESGKFPVIIDNKFGGVIFHEACGHPLEATNLVRGLSPFVGKLGQKVANEKLSACDDATIPNAWGSSNFDDEGTKTKKNILIENGVLKSYLVDKYSGEKLGYESTGSGRRQSYRFAPASRMSNTFIMSGKDKVSDIFESIEYGLYAKEMGGGSVNYNSSFNFAVLEGYIIRNGKICEPVRGATLIGKGNEVLQEIDMISDNLDHAQGVCGASSGQIPTNVGQPTLRVREITIGGR